jgi:hypothetical protein
MVADHLAKHKSHPQSRKNKETQSYLQFEFLRQVANIHGVESKNTRRRSECRNLPSCSADLNELQLTQNLTCQRVDFGDLGHGGHCPSPRSTSLVPATVCRGDDKHFDAGGAGAEDTSTGAAPLAVLCGDTAVRRGESAGESVGERAARAWARARPCGTARARTRAWARETLYTNRMNHFYRAFR